MEYLSVYVSKGSIGAYLTRGLIYGITGLIFEVLWTGLCSLLAGDLTLTAHTSLVMLPVYASVVFLEPMFDVLYTMGVSPVLRGACYALMIFACEYFSGKLFQIIGICPWRYNGRLNIEGVIRLDYAPLWLIVGLCYERLYRILKGSERGG
jgi:hypothetical protein